MKTQLLASAIATTLIIVATGTSQASDLRFAVSTLRSANKTFTPTVQAQPKSSAPAAPQLLLGAYLTDVAGGLQVSGTVPSSPASKVLNKGDIVRRIAALGQPTRTLNTLNQLEYAKRQIGPNRQAVLEVYRPESGVEYVWVTFHTAGELASFTRNSQKSEALSMFHSSNDNLVSR